jgi:hypothetical protein
MITTIFDVTLMNNNSEKPIPNVIYQYNKNIGGVDKFDQMIKYYSLK